MALADWRKTTYDDAMHSRPQDFFGLGRRGYHHGRLKEALVDAARQLVAERGPEGLTLAEAAKRVGVTGAAPYRHFPDRQALLGELARRGFELFSEKLSLAWGSGGPDASAAMRRLGEAYLAFAQAETGLYGAMFGNARALDAPGPGAAANKALAILRNAAAAVLAEAGAPGADPKDLAFEIWALSHGIAMLALAGCLDKARPESNPAAILSRAADGLIESAARRAARKGPWSL